MAKPTSEHDENCFQEEIEETLEEAMENSLAYEGIFVVGLHAEGITLRTAGISRVHFAYVIQELQRLYAKHYDEEPKEMQ